MNLIKARLVQAMDEPLVLTREDVVARRAAAKARSEMEEALNARAVELSKEKQAAATEKALGERLRNQLKVKEGELKGAEERLRRAGEAARELAELHMQDAEKREAGHAAKIKEAWDRARVLEEEVAEAGRKHAEERKALEKKRGEDVGVLERRLEESEAARDKERGAWERERAKMKRELDAARQAEVRFKVVEVGFDRFGIRTRASPKG